MRRLLIAAFAVALLPSTAASARTVGCDRASTGSFSAPSAKRDVVLGPLRMVGAREYADAPEVPWFKMPAVVRSGHRVTLRIAASAPSAVRFRGYGSRSDRRETVTLVGCPRGMRPSRGSGRDVRFWSGGFAPTPGVCVPLDVRVDRERRWRRVVISLGAGICAGT